VTRQDTWTQIKAAPVDGLHGLLGGLLGPMLALGGAMGLLYILTRQLPAVQEVIHSDGTRRKALVLAAQPKARASWARFAGDLRAAMLELRARRSAGTER
jgi:hypothetical protein